MLFAFLLILFLIAPIYLCLIIFRPNFRMNFCSIFCFLVIITLHAFSLVVLISMLTPNDKIMPDTDDQLSKSLYGDRESQNAPSFDGEYQPRSNSARVNSHIPNDLVNQQQHLANGISDNNVGKESYPNSQGGAGFTDHRDEYKTELKSAIANDMSYRGNDGIPFAADSASHLVSPPSQTLRDLTAKIGKLEQRIKELEGSLKTFPAIPELNYRERKRILVVGGAGFVGSHLVDRLMMSGHEVTVADNFFTGRKRNIEHWIGHPNFAMLTHDIVNPLYIEVDEIYHLASPASPPHYMYNPVKTVKTNTVGSINLLGLAKRIKARFLFASTSEVYGDPAVHPQHEEYWGNVNPNGPRACYDEGKRVAETLCYAYAKQDGVDIRIARIFNTYGPRMHMDDGRVVSNIILQVLQNESITVYGNGDQTRSFQYVSDLVDGLIALMASSYTHPVNLGNPHEITILDFAKFVQNLIPKSSSQIVYKEALQDDPHRRCPDISRAKKILNWEPKIDLKDGILKTIYYFAKELRLNGLATHQETSEGAIQDYQDFNHQNATAKNVTLLNILSNNTNRPDQNVIKNVIAANVSNNNTEQNNGVTNKVGQYYNVTNNILSGSNQNLSHKNRELRAIV